MQSYSVPSAKIHLQAIQPAQIECVKTKLDELLLKKGFVNLGIDTSMLNAWNRVSEQHKQNQFQIDYLEKIKKTTNYQNKNLDMSIRIIDFSNLEFKKKHTKNKEYEGIINDGPALELHIYNHRPGGFSSEAIDFYNDLIHSATIINSSDVVVIFSPPKPNNQEFYTFKLLNILSFIVLWSICFTLAMVIYLAAVKWILNKLNLKHKTKKILFVFGGFFLCTPYPFPLSIFGMFFLPSAFAISDIGSEYFWQLQAFIIPSYIFSLLFCFIIANKSFKKA